MADFNKIFIILLSFSLLCSSTQLFSQRGMIIPDSISGNFYKEAQLREKYWDTMGVSKRKGAYKQFSRWKQFWELRVNSDGSYPDVQLILDAFNIANKQEKINNTFQAMPTWKELGPTENPEGSKVNGGVGRINIVRFNPNNSQEVWVGSANGGAWKSTNGGSSWSPLYQTEFLSLGVSDIAISPSNPKVVYIATGDNDGSLSGSVCYSVGILKSTDGGNTWNTTGNISTLNENRIIARLWIHPTDDKIVIAGTTNGMIKTTDGGNTWKNVFTQGKIVDIEQMPNTPTTLYASSMGSGATYVYRSDNMGETWKSVLTLQGGRRTCIEVTPAAPNSIYALTANNAGAFHSLVVSTAKGDTWEQTNVFSTKRENYMDHHFSGNNFKDNTNGQGWYDLAMAVSPTNANLIFIGGVNIWKSTDRGKNFSPSAYWSYSNTVPYVHADIHDLKFVDNDLFATHDGGIDVTKNLGTSWTQMYKGIGIGQLYHFDNSQQNPDKIIIGLQDLGSHIKDPVWTNVGGGDGMGCAFDPKDDKRYYSSLYNGIVERHYNNGTSNVILHPDYTYPLFGVLDSGAWCTALAVSPSSKLYVGYSNIYASTNYGTTWTKQTNLVYSYSSTIRNIKASQKDENYVYAHTLNSIYYTNNAGTNWRTMGTPFSGNISYIIPHPQDPKMFYITYSGYSNGNKLYKYDGQKWINLSGNLPNIPVNCVEIQIENGEERIYVGTDIGVYYGLEKIPIYIRWGTGLPNTMVNELQIIPSKNLLRAATYGRGVWETSINNCAVENFTINADGGFSFCDGDSVKLYVETPNQNDVVWSNGQTGNEIWVKTEGIYYAASNTKSDCLKTSNTLNLTAKQVNTLNVNKTGTTEMCIGDSVRLSAANGFLEGSYHWNTGDTGRVLIVKKAGTYFVTAENKNSDCISTSDTIIVNAYEKPTIPTITYYEDTIHTDKKYDTLEASLGSKYQWYKNGTTINNQKSRRLVFIADSSSNADYTVIIANEGDCYSEQSEIYNYTSIVEDNNNVLSISPNPAHNTIEVLLPEKYYGKYSVSIVDINGKSIQEKSISIDGVVTLEVNALISGTYLLKLESDKYSISKTFIKTDK